MCNCAICAFVVVSNASRALQPDNKIAGGCGGKTWFSVKSRFTILTHFCVSNHWHLQATANNNPNNNKGASAAGNGCTSAAKQGASVANSGCTSAAKNAPL